MNSVRKSLTEDAATTMVAYYESTLFVLNFTCIGLQIYGHYRSIFNHCDMMGLQSYRIRRKNAE